MYYIYKNALNLFFKLQPVLSNKERTSEQVRQQAPSTMAETFSFGRQKIKLNPLPLCIWQANLLALGRTLFSTSMLPICYSDFCRFCYIAEIQCFAKLLLDNSHLWRATYVVSGMRTPAMAPIFLSSRFTLCSIFTYCRRSVPSRRVMMGSR